MHTNNRDPAMASYFRPDKIEAALAALAAGPRVLLAGGTDHYPARAVREPDEDVVDISGIGGLREIGLAEGVWRIPALATWTDVIEATLPPLFAGLKTAARQVGGWQVQNAGTVLGNVCNASPAADGIPALLALDAAVELRSLAGTRCVPLAAFVLGARRTTRRPDEMATALLIPDRAAESQFLKLGGRAYLVISISMVALTLARDGAGRIVHAAVAVGSCGPVARRLPGLEAALVGHVGSGDLVRVEHLAPLSPIDDVRATAAYRLAATLELLRRGLSTPLGMAA